ncbi:hypothetical protein HPULCUR_011981 [Helicostylum pulchrum]|uniref:Uncharacterized protein n=1 Tax=Helicostylum pulchrum TaxID=562976 RepID=A0ABP9YHM4_9FUNG
MTCSTKLLLMTITVLSVWLQLSQAYCVYNQLDGADSYFYITERDANARVSFKKRINSGQNECCPWNNRECNPHVLRDKLVKFHITFGLFDASLEGADVFVAYCGAGGGLVLTVNDVYSITATCNEDYGAVNSTIIPPIYA